MEDRNIISLLFERSEQAITELQTAFGALVHKVALGITGNASDAEEIENDTYLAVWKRVPPEKPDPLGAYVCATARNLSLKRLRSARAVKRSEDLAVPLEELDSVLCSDELSEKLSARELGESIDRFLDSLDPLSKALFVRRYYLCQPTAEAAWAVGITENNAFVKLSRIKKKLKQHLEKEGYVL